MLSGGRWLSGSSQGDGQCGLRPGDCIQSGLMAPVPPSPASCLGALKDLGLEPLWRGRGKSLKEGCLSCRSPQGSVEPVCTPVFGCLVSVTVAQSASAIWARVHLPGVVMSHVQGPTALASLGTCGLTAPA